MTDIAHYITMAGYGVATFLIIFFTLILLSKKSPKVARFIIPKMLQVFLKPKYLFGSYADNQIALRRWYYEDVMQDVIIMKITDKNMPFTFQVPSTTGISDEIVKMAIQKESLREQARAHVRELRKVHQCVVWYVEDHFLTRLIGCKKGSENNRLR